MNGKSRRRRNLFVGADDELHPLLGGLRRADFPVGDVGRDESQQAVQEDLRAVIYVVLLGGQFCEVLLLIN